MEIIEIIHDVGKIIVFLQILLVAFLLTAPTKRKLSNLLFAGFLLVTAFDMSGFFLAKFYEEQPFINQLKTASVLLQMPLYHFYVRSACYYNFKLEIRHWAHFIPFVVFLVLFIATNLSDNSFEFFDIASSVQYYGYIIGVFYVLSQYKKLYLENYSNSYLTYKWLFQTTVLFLTGNCISLLKQFSGLILENSLFYHLNLLVSLFALAVISWFVLKALRQPQLFSGIDINLKPSSEVPEAQSEEQTEILSNLADHMSMQKPYLDEELTLQKLATQVDIPEKQLSSLINQQLGKHFFDYINDFRIEDAKGLLKNKPELTVLEILYEVGFKSKSSFYTAFKKSTSQTPTSYRKSIS